MFPRQPIATSHITSGHRSFGWVESRQCECNHECRSLEQPETREARLETTSAQPGTKGSLHKTGKLIDKEGKLIDKEGKLEDSVSLNKPACQLCKMSGYRVSFAPFMPKCQAYLSVIVAAATNHSLASSLPQVGLCVAAAHVTNRA